MCLLFHFACSTLIHVLSKSKPLLFFCSQLCIPPHSFDDLQINNVIYSKSHILQICISVGYLLRSCLFFPSSIPSSRLLLYMYERCLRHAALWQPELDGKAWQLFWRSGLLIPLGRPWRGRVLDNLKSNRIHRLGQVLNIVVPKGSHRRR